MTLNSWDNVTCQKALLITRRSFGEAYASASGSGEIHIHGTGIDLFASTAATLTGLRARKSSRIHADAAAFNMSIGTGGSITRIADETTGGEGIHAPYL